MAKINMEVLPQRLIIISIQKEDLKNTLHSILSTAFYKSSFFTYTETPQNISLIIEHQFLDLLSASYIKICPTIWRIVEVYAGDCGLADLSKTVHMISEPFAKNDISIFQLSTYENDFTLVPEDRLKEGLDCLSDTFNICDLNQLDITQDNVNTLNMSKEDNSDLIENNGLKQSHIVREPLNNGSIYIASLRDKSVNVMKPIIERILYPKQKGFFSFALINDTYSFVLDQAALNLFPPDSLNILSSSGDSSQWHLMEICNENEDGLGFEESGIVASYTSVLSEAGISCFYISTFLSDFVLVPIKEKNEKAEDFERAKNSLRVK